MIYTDKLADKVHSMQARHALLKEQVTYASDSWEELEESVKRNNMDLAPCYLEDIKRVYKEEEKCTQ